MSYAAPDEAGQFDAAVLARPFWRSRFGVGQFGAAPFRRRTFWRSHAQVKNAS